MKKIIVFLMAAIMCVGFFSCRESSVDKSNGFTMLTENTIGEFTVDEANTYFDMIDEITDFIDKNQQALIGGTIKETEFANMYYIRAKKEE